MLKDKVPGPRRWSPFGSLAELRSNPLSTLLAAREEFGDVVKFRAGIWYSYLLSNPEDVKHVLQDNNQDYHKGFTWPDAIGSETFGNRRADAARSPVTSATLPASDLVFVLIF